MSEDLPRIGDEPDCAHPTCLLLGRYLIATLHGSRIVCSLHTDWNGSDE